MMPIDCPAGSAIPVEIVSEEEMALIEAAFVAAARSVSSSPPRGIIRHVRSLCHASPSGTSPPDIEDSPLRRFRPRRALAVTDITATEWCEKQMEFMLRHGRPEQTEAMKAGSNRHLMLEKEVLERVDIRIVSAEESWAVKFMNFIVGTNQLLFDGLTRELPVVGFVGGAWMIGIIDEIQMLPVGANPSAILVDTKTRTKPTLPSEAQKRNARLQLMCYKSLWDNLIVHQFPSNNFLEYFNLNPEYKLSRDVQLYTNSLGFHAKTFEDALNYFKEACSLLPLSADELLLRYELQTDHSLLEEYRFSYDAAWLDAHLKESMGFWTGKRPPKFVSDTEKWKCHFCKFATDCPRIAADKSG